MATGLIMTWLPVYSLPCQTGFDLYARSFI